MKTSAEFAQVSAEPGTLIEMDFTQFGFSQEASDQANEIFDFTRCQRADGTYYGTRGKCRKGTEVEAKLAKLPVEKLQKLAQYPKLTPDQKKKVDAAIANKTVQPQAKTKTEAKQKKQLDKKVETSPEKMKEGAYKPKPGDGPRGSAAEIKPGAFGENRTFNPDAIRKRIEEISSDPKLSAKAKKTKLKTLEIQAAQAENNKAFLDRLQKNAPAGTKIEVEENLVVMKSKTKSGDTITTAFGPNLGYGFKVNDTHDAGTVTDRRAQMEIASDVRKQYDAIIQSLPPGAIVKTSAYYRDGKGAGRQRIYERMGFSKATPGDDIFGVKNEDGTISPLPAGYASASKLRDQAMDPKAMFFAEQKMDGWSQDEMWRALIFGD